MDLGRWPYFFLKLVGNLFWTSKGPLSKKDGKKSWHLHSALVASFSSERVSWITASRSIKFEIIESLTQFFCKLMLKNNHKLGRSKKIFTLSLEKRSWLLKYHYITLKNLHNKKREKNYFQIQKILWCNLKTYYHMDVKNFINTAWTGKKPCKFSLLEDVNLPWKRTFLLFLCC